MDIEHEMTILNYCLSVFFKKGRINTKKTFDLIRINQEWYDIPESDIKEIKDRIRGIKKGKALIHCKKIKIDGFTIYRTHGSEYITMDQILNLIKDRYRFIEFKQLEDGKYAISYTRDDENNIIITHDEISNCQYGSGIQSGFFIISKKSFAELKEKVNLHKDRLKELDEMIHTEGGHSCVTDIYPLEFFKSWKSHKIDKLHTISSILNEVDDGIEYISNKIDDIEEEIRKDSNLKKFIKKGFDAI